MQRALIILHKPSVKDQVVTLLNAFKIDEIDVFVQSDSGRLDIPTVKEWECFKRYDSTKITYNYLDFRKVTYNTIRRLCKNQIYDFVAFPLIIGRPFYKNVRKLRRHALVVNLSDGTSELGSILKSYLRVELKSKLGLIRIIIKSIERYFYKADICFSPFYPLSNVYSKITLPVMPVEVPEKKKEFIIDLCNQEEIHPQALFISGYEFSHQRLSEITKIKNYISTSKDKEIIINGKKYKMPFFLCAEELLTFFEPQIIVGYKSDAVAYAALKFPDSQCVVYDSMDVSKLWGKYYNRIYTSQLKSLKMLHSNPEESNNQC